MEKARLQYLLEREQTKQNTEIEAEELATWYDAFENKANFTATLSDNAQKVLEVKLYEGISRQTNLATATPSSAESTFSMSYWIRIAAVFLVILGIGSYFYTTQWKTITEATAYGERRALQLPDGTEVILNGNSEISYASRWKENEVREVFLSGEAFFNVVHTSTHQKFRVRTSDEFSIDVLGTQFTLSSRKSGTRVVLEEGKVQCNIGSTAKDTLVLRPGELVQFTQKPSEYVRKQVEIDTYSAWKDHKLVFDNTTLSEISSMLEETYGLHLESRNQDYLQRKISGSVPTDSIPLLLSGIAAASDLHFQQEGNKVIVTE